MSDHIFRPPTRDQMLARGYRPHGGLFIRTEVFRDGRDDSTVVEMVRTQDGRLLRSRSKRELNRRTA